MDKSKGKERSAIGNKPVALRSLPLEAVEKEVAWRLKSQQLLRNSPARVIHTTHAGEFRVCSA